MRAYAQEQELSEIDEFNMEKLINIGNLFSPDDVHTIFKHVTSPDFEWLVHLALEDGSREGGWCVITELSNLASLMIYSTSRNGPYSSGVTDRVIKAWSIAAKEEGALSLLRVLCLHDCRYISDSAFQFIDALPALTLCRFIEWQIWPEESSNWQIFDPE